MNANWVSNSQIDIWVPMLSKTSQEAGTNPFFDELFKHWNVRLRPGVSCIVVEVEDSDDESTDFSDFIMIKEDPYGGGSDHAYPPKKAKMEPLSKNPSTTMAQGVEPATKTVVVIDSPDPTRVKEEPLFSAPQATCGETPENHKNGQPVCVTTDEGDVEVEQRIRALKLFGEELVKNVVYGLWVFYI